MMTNTLTNLQTDGKNSAIRLLKRRKIPQSVLQKPAAAFVLGVYDAVERVILVQSTWKREKRCFCSHLSFGKFTLSADVLWPP